MTTVDTRSRYIPWLFVAGFAVVIGVNAIMIFCAVASFSGLSADRARDRGLHYNDVVAEQKRRDALGWRVETTWRADSSQLEIAVFDRSSATLSCAQVFVELIRPAEKRPPVDVVLTDRGPGRFSGRVDLPARGNWDADIVVECGGQRFASTRRMFLR